MELKIVNGHLEVDATTQARLDRLPRVVRGGAHMGLVLATFMLGMLGVVLGILGAFLGILGAFIGILFAMLALVLIPVTFVGYCIQETINWLICPFTERRISLITFKVGS